MPEAAKLPLLLIEPGRFVSGLSRERFGLFAGIADDAAHVAEQIQSRS